MIATILCIVAVNLLLAQVLARLVIQGPVLRLGPPMLAALFLVALVSGAAAVVGWRTYVNERRRVS
ncbi:MAG: hypothetical protein IT305_14580 [Chloroflexi bacterium]|nr:hypothetical protein [Chloroflexota bacterium]